MIQRNVDGLIIQADDGTLYFIPTSAFNDFRVFDDSRAELAAQLPGGGETAGVLQAVNSTITINVPEGGEQVTVGLAVCNYLAGQV